MNYITIPLSSSHQKDRFDCGNDLLNFYIHKQAGQDVKRKLAACFVIVDENKTITGYYTLSNAGIPSKNLPEQVRKKLPKSYYHLPVTLLGRLAVDNKSKGKGLGRLLLIDALRRSFFASKSIGSIAVVVDPVDDDAVSFYEKFGFIRLPDSGKMFIPMKTIEKLLIQSQPE